MCDSSGFCVCEAAYYESSVLCSVVQSGSYPAKNVTYSSSIHDWWGIATSDDLKTILATVNGGNIYKSTDEGETWDSLPNAGSKNWGGISCNGNCSKIVSIEQAGSIWLSTTGGASWSSLSNAGNKDWTGIVGNAELTNLMATVSNGEIWKSTNSGLSWTELSNSFTNIDHQISSSSDFSKFAIISDMFVVGIQDSWGDGWNGASMQLKKMDGSIVWQSSGPSISNYRTWLYTSVNMPGTSLQYQLHVTTQSKTHELRFTLTSGSFVWSLPSFWSSNGLGHYSDFTYNITRYPYVIHKFQVFVW